MEGDIIFSIHPSLRLTTILYVLGAALLLIGLFVFFIPLSFLSSAVPGYFWSIIAGLLGLAVLIFAASSHIQSSCTTYELTRSDLRITNRLIGVTENIIPLSKIQDVKFSYSFAQSFFGVGDIYLASADEHASGDVALLNIDNPAKYKEEILAAMAGLNKDNN
jgi:uncharacterized membrane protein YdbT with pleckstrin-like domain